MAETGSLLNTDNIVSEQRGIIMPMEASNKRTITYVDDYPSYGGTPIYGGRAPRVMPTWSCTPSESDSADDERPCRAAQGGPSSIAAAGGDGGIGRHRLQLSADAEVLQGKCCADYDEQEDAALTSISRPVHMPFFITGPGQVHQNDLSPNVEPSRSHVVNMEDGFIVEFPEFVKPSTENTKGKPPLPINLKFKDVMYKVTLQEKSRWRKKTIIEKSILHGIIGSVACGEMLAMLGPSGCGKTTLLSLLGGRKPHTHNFGGFVLYNDIPYTKRLKKRIGFVTQDDILLPHLSVGETLTFTAMLRLGNGLTKEQKVERVREVLIQLGLQKCVDTTIGNQFISGISGGERKRVCIGQEILINPSLLFLDEPTSGLDSTTALRIIKLLHNLAHEGRTVVTTIHQPSSRAFHMFDKLLLLSEGHELYFGKAREAMKYFESIGFLPVIPMNPADFLLDLCSGNGIEISLPSNLQQRDNATSKKISMITKHSTAPSTPSIQLAQNDKKYLLECFQNKIMSMEQEGNLRSLYGEHEGVTVTSKALEKCIWETTWCEQFTILLVRGFKERRHEYLGALRTVQVVASAFLAGCLWWGSRHSTPQQIEDKVGLIFFMTLFWGYLPLFTTIFTFPLERAILAKERACDMYRLSAYFMARTLGDLPLDMALPFIFIIILYFMANLQQTVTGFVLTLLTIFLIVIASQGFGLLLGATMMDVEKATTFASIAILAFMLGGGFFVKHIPPFIAWVKYLSFQAHTHNILMRVQYPNGHTFPSSSSSSSSSSLSISCSSSAHALFNGAMQSVLALFLMVFGYRLLAYFALRRLGTTT